MKKGNYGSIDLYFKEKKKDQAGQHKLIKLFFKGSGYEKLRALSKQEEVPMNEYLSVVVNWYLSTKKYPKGKKNEP